VPYKNQQIKNTSRSCTKNLDAIVLPTNSFHGLREEIAEAFSQPTLLEDLRQQSSEPPGTLFQAPVTYHIRHDEGMARISINHSSLGGVRHLEGEIIRNFWNQKWLYPKPKVDPEEATLQDFQPLNLLDTSI